jgi:hypothetical protein
MQAKSNFGRRIVSLFNNLFALFLKYFGRLSINPPILLRTSASGLFFLAEGSAYQPFDRLLRDETMKLETKQRETRLNRAYWFPARKRLH